MARHHSGLPPKKYLILAVAVGVAQAISVYAMTDWVSGKVAGSSPHSGEVPERVCRAPTKQPREVVYTQLKPIVVNPAGTDGIRFLATKVDLRLESSDVASEIDHWRLASKMRDRLIDLLGSKTLDQLRPEHAAALKAEIRRSLNRILGSGAVIAVYFQDFVIQ